MNKNRYLQKIIIIQAMMLFICMLFLNVNSFAQKAASIKISGVIVDKAENPLPGATVIVTGTTTGVISDIDGKFQISCPKGSTLTISFVGYKNSSVVASEEEVKVVLEENYVTLGETVVVGIGYGTMRKSDLTGAIASVGTEEMKKGIITSSEQLLQGKVAGLTVIQGSGDPASGASLRLRGGTSLTASNGPLIVVDGIAGVDINTVNPSEIVSMDVLKDASAAAIYGSRGANGVIIVTTNRANKGKIMQYQGYVAVGSVLKNLDMLSANQWRQYVRDNKVTSAVDYGGDTDWQKELEQTAISHSHAIMFSNSNDKSGFRVSANYLNNEGIIKRTGLDRLGASISGYQYGLNNKLKLEVGLNTNFDKWHPLNGLIYERMLNLSPVIPVYNPDGSFTKIGGTKYDNPVEINTNRTADNTKHRLLGYGKIELEIIKGLKAYANGSYEYNSTQSRLYVPSYAVMGATDKGFGQRTLGDYTTKQLEAYLTYDKQLNSENKINIMAGYSYMDNTYEGYGAQRKGFDTDLFLYNNLAAGIDYSASDVYSYKGQAKLISFYGRVNYNLLNKYMFTGTLRRDGSSRFGTNNKWGLFPSASIAWRVSDEPFMQSAKGWLDNLKFRAGYGMTGNQDGIGEYKSLDILGTGSATYYDGNTQTWKQSYGPIQNSNPELKWESTSQFNVGIDFSLIGKINGTLEVYQKKTTDLLYTYAVPQPPYLVGTMLANVGDLSNKGIELSLNANLIHTSDFNWDINLTLAKNIQKVDRLSNQTYECDSINSGSLHGLTGMSGKFSQVIKQGYAVGTFVGPICTGIDSLGKFILEDNGASKVIGDVQPKISFGFGTSLSYKNIDLEISTYGMLGQKVLNCTAMELSNPKRLPTNNTSDLIYKAGITSPMTYSSYWVEDASFLRIQSISLGYSFSAKNIGFEKIRVYVTGENLFVFTNYTGVDPEVTIDGLNTPGMDWFNAYPRPRTFLFGLNVSF
jgi:TonB-dependent starch-binding outer membrane protein SusC